MAVWRKMCRTMADKRRLQKCLLKRLKRLLHYWLKRKLLQESFQHVFPPSCKHKLIRWSWLWFFVRTENLYCHKVCIQRESLTLKGKIILATIGCFAERYIYLNWRCVISKGWMFCASLEHKPVFHGHLGLEIKKTLYFQSRGCCIYWVFFCCCCLWFFCLFVLINLLVIL